MIGFSNLPMDFDSLRYHVECRLCELGALEPDQFPLTQREIIRKGKTCAVYFCLHGPRSVKLTAIADFNARSIVLYGTDGSRRDVVQWDQLPDQSRAA
ncbi:MAG: hypothetical protein AAF539_02080 [Planctomycetota bacterium]